MNWYRTWRSDPYAREIADRHYNRQSPGSREFVPPGRCLVLVTRPYDALWITSWPYAEYVKHAWGGAWVNSAFRHEGGRLASELIREAVAATRAHYASTPALGMISFVDPLKVRRSREPGRVFRLAGFRLVGQTKGGLLAYQILPSEMPPPRPASEFQTEMFGAAT